MVVFGADDCGAKAEAEAKKRVVARAVNFIVVTMLVLDVVGCVVLVS